MSTEARRETQHHAETGPGEISKFRLAAVVAVCTAIAAGASWGQTDCMNVATGNTDNCTANDVSFVLIGLGDQSDGCVSVDDTVTIQLGALLSTTSRNRYDIGMWVATDGASAQTGASCVRQILHPVSVTPSPFAPGGTGPFRSLDGDLCGDITTDDSSTVNGQIVNASYKFDAPTTIPCASTTPPSGFVNLPTCSSWDNNAGTTCNSIAQAVPGNKAKCRCDVNQVSSIPLPNLEMLCGCTVGANNTLNCTVSYQNPINCTNPANNPTPPERFSCGTASFVRFRTEFDTANGNVTTATDPETLPSSSNVSIGSGVITWNPLSGSDGVAATPETPGSLNVIGANNQDTMSFTYQYTGPLANPPALSFQTFVDWSNDQSTWVPQAPTALTCTTNPVTTPVTLGSVRAVRDGDEVSVSWSTETETGNIGFRVLQKVGDHLRPVIRRTIPSQAVDAIGPTHYRARIPASLLVSNEIYIEDISTGASTRLNGPFAVDGRLHGHEIPEERLDWASIRDQNERDRESGRGGMKNVVRAAKTSPPSPVARLSVRQDGLYRVTYESLLAAGANFSGVQTGELALLSRGQSVPIRTSGNGQFGPGSYVEFIGSALDTLYTDTNVYMLIADRKSALRIGSDTTKLRNGVSPVTTYVETARFERDREYSPASPNGDPWYDTRMLVFTSPGEFTFDLPVDSIQGTADATLEVQMWGQTDLPTSPDHHVQVRVNGVQVAESRFDGLVDQPTQARIPAGTLAEGANTLSIRLPGDTGAQFDLVNLDGYRISYRRSLNARFGRLRFNSAGEAFRVTGLTSPNVLVYRGSGAALRRVENVTVQPDGAGFAASFAGPGSATDTYEVWSDSAVLTPAIGLGRDSQSVFAGRAQYLVISHPDFVSGLSPLLVEKEAQGLTVKVVETDDLYSAFTGGIFDPAAIQAYVAYAARDLGTEYVLLVGGDSYDYRDFLGQGAISYLPSLYAETSSSVKFAPVDSLFADIDGDGLQDLAIGRLPVRTAQELDSVIGKTLAYSGKAYGKTAVFAADGFDTQSQTSFTQYSDGLVTRLPSDWNGRRAYIDTSGLADARAALIQAINDGVALTTYFGHSGPTVWSFSGLFSAVDASNLANLGRPTVVTQWGCWNTYYVSPTFNTLGHKLLLSGDRGAAAVMGASTLTEASSDRALALLLAPKLTRQGSTIGKAVLEAKRELAAAQTDVKDVLLGFTILGDPALAVEP